ncbi:MAG: hypothetical protein JO219_12055 [Candidatus Eremiobacteraeota bacterium]|nr:hypothetical protein [Candidatus Eremiobacteraeota bacterium]MBV8364988.1 hypothetical protein [Candidatus Eremiobacteraeota bacterium]
MEVVAILGERLYHAAGSQCHRKLTQESGDRVLTITAALAHEVGMEPCGVCMSGNEEQRATP